jgi:hypothetical protein
MQKEIITQLFESLGIAAILSTTFSVALVFIVRKLIEQFFSKDLERFKTDLEKEVLRYKTQFEALHAERAQVIKEVYKRIVRTQDAFESLIRPLQLAGEPSLEEKAKRVASEFNNLSEFFKENRLYFEEQLAQEIDKLLEKFYEIWIKWGEVRDLKEGGERTSEVLKRWRETWEKIKEEIPPIKKSIEQKFRDIVGIDLNLD